MRSASLIGLKRNFTRFLLHYSLMTTKVLRKSPTEKAEINQGNTPRLAKARYLNSSSFYGFDPLSGAFTEDPIQGLIAGSKVSVKCVKATKSVWLYNILVVLSWKLG